MTIRRCEDWGQAGIAPSFLPVFASDAALCRFLNDASRDRRSVPVVGLTGGDLWRTVGGSADRPAPEPGAPGLLLPVDLGTVLVDDVEVFFAAHVIARRGWWRGELVAAMNAQYIGRWDVAPRSHPNDGRLDVVRVDPAMSIGDRWRAERRLPTGTHVPHPHIEQHRLPQVHIDLERPLDLTVDGTSAGRHRRLELKIVPDGLIVVI
ncbi:MAG: diacylglycerol kinase family protein [Acidimicrobiia bacterium]